MHNLNSSNSRYKNNVNEFLRRWRNKNRNDPPYTRGGMAFRERHGSARYSANVASVAMLAAKFNLDRSDNRRFAREQIHYMLGDPSKGRRSLVVGFGFNPPKRVHHRAA